jgi:hypothetical protein
MFSGTNRPHSCGVEPLERRYLMVGFEFELPWGPWVSEFVHSPGADQIRRGAVIANGAQVVRGHVPPPPVVEHFLDAITP